MKKNFIYLLAVTLFMGLFTACSQQETTDQKTGKSKLVSVSAQLPVEFAKTRALPEASGHKLRCILEVWSKEETPSLIYRSEKLSTDASGDKLSFEFNLDAGLYDCLMWADFIDASAAMTDGRYADKYYTTTDLRKVTLKDASSLYNSDACDAFFASQELDKSDLEEIQSFDATLKRPFAKLIVSEKNKTNFGKCKTMTISHKVPASFNVAEGTTSIETVKATLTDAAPIGAGDTDLRLFSCYAFAEADGALQEIALTFKDTDGKELRNTAIPAGVAFQRNHCTKAKGHLIAEATDNTQVEVGVDDKWEADVDSDVNPVEPKEEVKVGSFYYSDGSWSEVLNKNKTCVGIVFDLATEDSKDNYPDLAMNKINGWVVAIDNIGSKSAWASQAISDPIEGVAFLSSMSACDTELLGYKNSKAISAASILDTTFPANAACTAWTPSIAGTSDWYMPSIGQLIKLFNAYKTLNPKIMEANGVEIASDVYLSSTLYKGNIPLGITFKEDDANYGTPRGQKIASPYNARAILTF